MKAMRWCVLFVCAALLCACSDESSVSADNNTPCDGECGAKEYCIEVLVAASVEGGLEVGDMFCSACPKDCAADMDHPVCVGELGVCGATNSCGVDESLTVEGGVAVCKKGSGGNNPGGKDEGYSLDISEKL